MDGRKVNASIQNAIEAKRASNDSGHIDSIAAGVEAKLDPYSAFSRVVNEKTISIARQLGIPEEEIKKWVAAKGNPEPDGRTKPG